MTLKEDQTLFMAKEVKYEQVQKTRDASFHYEWSKESYQDEIALHFHPEAEVICILKGSGYRMMGDFSEPFTEGEVIFVPPNLPHCWIYTPESCDPYGNRECIFVQFAPSFVEEGMSFFDEWKYAAHKFGSFIQGIKIAGPTTATAIRILKQMQGCPGSEKLQLLFSLILSIVNSASLQPIGIPGNLSGDISKSMHRLQVILRYVVENYRKKISLTEIASLVHLSEASFSAFFKKETGRRFLSFVNEYRLEAVCSALKNDREKSISEIAWECGFTDIPYFNRYFKEVKQMSPGKWKKEYFSQHPGSSVG
ncbi:MAG TPA: AraC family transcriptional regulator [Porphyromonadaceae bacterium]|jgi:AraC-like DNA-binding protein|nr:AraC family transcriptional regulator [Porphyromonadaceae bacterium]